MTPAAVLLAAVATRVAPELVEPTAADLQAIEAEWPVIAAEVAVVDAEIAFLGCPDRLSRRHLRRSQHHLARVIAAHHHNLIGAFA